MDEQHRSAASESGPDDEAYPPGRTEAFETRAFDTPAAETRQFPPAQGPWTAPRPGQYPDRYTDPRQPMAAPQPPAQYRPPSQSPAQNPPTGYAPLAHEGGLPYGNPPAPVHPQHQQFLPQHLVPPQQFAAGPYPQHPQYPQPYMHPQQFMQQTVFVHNGRRVNHGLHLVLTLLTAGLWLPVWIILSIANS